MAIIPAGGSLRIGSRYVAVPLSELQLAQNDHCTLPRATKEYLTTLPPVSYDATPTRSRGASAGRASQRVHGEPVRWSPRWRDTRLLAGAARAMPPDATPR